MKFEVSELLQSLEDKSRKEIISILGAETSVVESKLYGVRWWPRLRELGWPEYVNKLKWYLFFLRFWQKPGGVNIQPLKKIAENLVEKWEFEEEVLRLF